MNRVRVAGLSLITATVLFAVVFTVLAVRFGYPDVLDQPAAAVLPALAALGASGRAVWVVYGLIPLLLVPVARGVADLARVSHPRLSPWAGRLAWATALAMMTGLLRWPTLHWTYAMAWPSASDAARAVIAARFDLANRVLGNVIGEFAGELLLNGFLLMASVVVARRAGFRWLAPAGVAAAALGWIAMCRNLTPAVSALADANNTVLPLWMLAIGLALVVSTRRPARG